MDCWEYLMNDWMPCFGIRIRFLILEQGLEVTLATMVKPSIVPAVVNGSILAEEIFSENVAFLRENIDHMFVLLMGAITCFLQVVSFYILNNLSKNHWGGVNPGPFTSISFFWTRFIQGWIWYAWGRFCSLQKHNKYSHQEFWRPLLRRRCLLSSGLWACLQWRQRVGGRSILWPHQSSLLSLPPCLHASESTQRHKMVWRTMWHLQAAFAATCMTIVSGATAERMDYAGYLITRCVSSRFVGQFLSKSIHTEPQLGSPNPYLTFSSVVVTGVVYPVATHWSWTSLGWLATEWGPERDLNLLSFQGLHGFCWICCGSSGWCYSLLAWLCHPWSQVQYSHSFGFIDCSLVQDWQVEKGLHPRSLYSLCRPRIPDPRLWVPRL